MGIGKQMALELAKLYKCHFTIIDRRKDLFDLTVKDIETLGGKCECINADLSNEGSVSELVKGLLKKFNKIDLFLYNEAMCQ